MRETRSKDEKNRRRTEMKRRKLRTMALAMAGCGGSGGSSDGGDSSSGGGSNGKAACIFGVGGLGDQAFNDLTNEGLKRAQEELNIEYDYAEPTQVSDFELFLRDMASTGEYSVIISLGFDSVDALTKVSAEFPEQQFALIDSSIEADNVASYEGNEQEGAFLVGALAGLMLDQPDVYNVGDGNTAGFIGAMDTPLINKFYAGYAAGIQYVNPDATILRDYVAGDNPFGDTATAKEIAISQNNQGAGIEFHAAGGSGLGMIEAAGEYDFLAIGCNTNQNTIDPDHVVASMLKRVDTAAYEIVKAACVDDNLGLNSTVTLGLADEGIDYTLEGSNITVNQEDIDAVEQIRQLIIDGELEVPSSEEEIADFLANNQWAGK